MNPLGLILIGLGLILIIVGFKGSQHNLVTVLQGVKGGGKATVTNPSPGTPGSNNPAPSSGTPSNQTPKGATTL